MDGSKKDFFFQQQQLLKYTEHIQSLLVVLAILPSSFTLERKETWFWPWILLDEQRGCVTATMYEDRGLMMVDGGSDDDGLLLCLHQGIVHKECHFLKLYFCNKNQKSFSWYQIVLVWSKMDFHQFSSSFATQESFLHPTNLFFLCWHHVWTDPLCCGGKCCE